MTMILALLCLIAAIGLLIALSIIDLRIRLLPNTLVLPFALLAPTFHILTLFEYATIMDMIAGGLLGGGLLYGIRIIANRLYGQDALGLGDVKLMAAAGLWLGHWVLIAMSLGAFLGMAHGLVAGIIEARRAGTRLNLNTLEVPAGPGFALGIAIIALYRFQSFFTGLF